MKILALNGTYRKNGTTTTLINKALEGAATIGAQTEHLLLKDFDIRYCTNCLKCYGDVASEIAPCTHDDDMTAILKRIKKADGVLFGSPVHMGYVTGLMHVFMERACFRLARPTGEIFGLKGCPEPRLTDKPRAAASIVTAGWVPEEMRQYCDLGTQWLKENVPMLINGEFVIDQYAAAYFPKELKDEEWHRAFFLRELTETQQREAFKLGKTFASRISDGNIGPYDVATLMEAFEQPENSD
ncbi:MAG: flavodoxin family protein [Desulfofustis sp.]|nr:flavodoxin family protein [Desulfofustis sp.]